MKTKISLILIFICLFSFLLPTTLEAQKKKKKKTDVIYVFDKDPMHVIVRRISNKYIYYIKPGERKMQKIQRGLVNKIEYKNGRKETINKKKREVGNVTDYKKIRVTDNPDDVLGLIPLGEVKASYEADPRSYSSGRSLRKSCEIILRKKAANKEATIILITHVKNNRAYGEVPSITMTAEAYKGY